MGRAIASERLDEADEEPDSVALGLTVQGAVWLLQKKNRFAGQCVLRRKTLKRASGSVGRLLQRRCEGGGFVSAKQKQKKGKEKEEVS